MHGSQRGDEMPAWVADKSKRIEKIRAAQAELEAEAKAAVDEERRVLAEAEDKRRAEGRKKNGKDPASPPDEPDGTAQRNFTDPESHILTTKDGYIQGWNAEAAVDGEAQIIVADGLRIVTGHEFDAGATIASNAFCYGHAAESADGIELDLAARALRDFGPLGELGGALLDVERQRREAEARRRAVVIAKAAPDACRCRIDLARAATRVDWALWIGTLKLYRPSSIAAFGSVIARADREGVCKRSAAS